MTDNRKPISKDTEEKRLDDFKKISENWDRIPDYAAGKLDGMISAFAMFYLKSEKKTGLRS